MFEQQQTASLWIINNFRIGYLTITSKCSSILGPLSLNRRSICYDYIRNVDKEHFPVLFLDREKNS